MRVLASMVALGCLLSAARIQRPQVPAIVEEVRNALGGEAALAAVTAFSMDAGGVWFSNSGNIRYSVRIDCQLPDKIVVTRLQAERGSSITERNGINGNDLIDRAIPSPSFPPAQPAKPGMATETPESKSAERDRKLLRGKQWFAALTLLLFARSNPTYPLELVDAGAAELQDAKFRLIEARASGQSAVRLYVDSVSHQPMIATWMATREPPALPGALTLMPPADVVEALNTSPIEHELHVGDYKVSNGVKWPRLFIEYIGGREVEELTVRSVTLNPRFPPDRFLATK